ncbi:MAG: UDP-N-acetylmuramate--L-alanine ligase [Anaerolineae bacterium]|nr:UDP-N-acetylmuramate--L-alanine ligase [Anaerolineae bacterium]
MNGEKGRSYREEATKRLEGVHHVHFVGIGGIGMSGIARVLLEEGYRVSGSDLRVSPLTEALVGLGGTVYEGHAAKNIAGADLVVLSSAVPAHNPEVVAAQESGIPVVSRAQILGELMKGRYGVAVAGTHGKTTTSAMIALILMRAGLDPTIIVGGVIPELGSNAKAGKGKYIVLEADEYQRTFLGLSPSVAVVTNIEMDHPDYFRDLEDICQAYLEFVRLVPPEGEIFLCSDDPMAQRLQEEPHLAEITTYGLGPRARWRAADLAANAAGGSDFRVLASSRPRGEFSLRIPGRHNVRNGLAALAVADYLGIDLMEARKTLAQFRGVERRFEVKGEASGVIIIDDYAHHPSEIKATLTAAKERYPERMVWAVFQPHTYSRTKALLSDFAASFGDADQVVVTDIYPARESDDLGVNSQKLLAAMNHQGVHYIGALSDVVLMLCQRLRGGDLLITLGAGDIYQVGEEVLARLKRRER